MQLIIRDLAKKQMGRVAKWVEEENTEGAGDRWLDRFESVLHHKAQIGIKHAICKSKGLSRYGHRCFTYNDKWVVSYKIFEDRFVVYRVMLGANIKS